MANLALARVVQMPEVVTAMQRQGAEPAFFDERAMGRFMAADAAQWQQVAARAKIVLDWATPHTRGCSRRLARTFGTEPPRPSTFSIGFIACQTPSD